jgi:hypothetical protein
MVGAKLNWVWAIVGSVIDKAAATFTTLRRHDRDLDGLMSPILRLQTMKGIMAQWNT